jgi:hypothetical protein
MGSQKITIPLQVPEVFGGYAVIAEIHGRGRVLAAALVRVPRPDPGRQQFPAYALDMPGPEEITEEVFILFKRLGIKGCRLGVEYHPAGTPACEQYLKLLGQWMEWAAQNDVTVMFTIMGGSAPQPLGRPRPWLDEKDMMLETKSDSAWLPAWDEDFQVYCHLLASRWGWPKGPLNAVELWNEPWEGISISGWGADVIRYRDLYQKMALGIEEARSREGAQVLIGGACSSSNTRDKLFPDGKDTFLKWLDFVSIHYQPMGADPALVPAWQNRPRGRVRVWDTESWMANSEDRVAACIASMRAQGQDRTAGIYGGNVFTSLNRKFDGTFVAVTQTWSPAVAVAASQKFIGQRPFRELLFQNGLPWVLLFDGLPDAGPNDGTAVVIGDLGGVYDRNRLLFRTVYGLRNARRLEDLERQLITLPSVTPESRRKDFREAMDRAEILERATLTVKDFRGEFVLYDFYGNPQPARNGQVVIPLNGCGYFLRTAGKAGSFARLVAALREGRLEGLQPLEIVAHDLLDTVQNHPLLRLKVTNVLNRPVTGFLEVQLGHLNLELPRRRLNLEGNESQELTWKISGGTAVQQNQYLLQATFDGGADGNVTKTEILHVNLISARSIQVDGRLEDWQGVLPQMVSRDSGLRVSSTEKAWLPFAAYDGSVQSGEASGYLAYDDQFFYFAAKIADSTPYEGNVRFANRDDNQYFYPLQVKTPSSEEGGEMSQNPSVLIWPEGVRRFSYRKNPDLPSGNNTDNVQLAFNVVPAGEKPLALNPPGTMPRFMVYPDTDYEFALNQVAERFGGGSEIWRLAAPGIPRKHYYPRQPSAALDGGAVKASLLSLRREGNTRIVEAAIPWEEIPLVQEKRLRGETIKFSFRFNDNLGPALELAAGRSVSKENFLAFHDDWGTHWANELEFVFEKKPGSARR